MSTSKGRLIVGGVLVAVVGGFVLWLQAGLLFAVLNLGLGGYSLQSHLSSAADGALAGTYDDAQAEFEAAQASAQQVARSATASQLNLVARVPGFGVATANWSNAAAAATDVTGATGGLLSLYGDLSGKGGGPKIFRDGAVDLQMLTDLPARVTSAAQQLDNAEAHLTGIVATSPLSGPLAKVQAKALKEMKPVQAAMGALQTIAPVLPEALGANGVRRYLVAICNQAEMRASGGAPLSLVLVEFDNGRVSIPIKGQTSTQLFPPLNAPVTWWGPAANPFFPGNPRTAPFVVTNTHPNLLFSGQEMAGAWVGGSFPEVDGIITIDLTAIGAVLDATGPVESEAYGSVDGSQLGKILLIDAYQTFGQEDAAARQEANQKLIDDLLTRILSGDDIVSAAKAMISTAPGRHVQFWLRNPALEGLALQSNTAGAVNDPDTGDWSAVYTQNGNQSKVDVFQQRNVLVTAQLSEDGSAHVTQQMTVTNATPADRPEGPPERIGYETSWLKAAYLLYVPDAAQKYSVSYPSDFAIRPFKNQPQLGNGWVNDGFGHRLIRVTGWTSPGGQNSVSVSYDLPAGTFATSDSGRLEYTLQAEPQALFNNSVLTVQVVAPAGWSPVAEPGMNINENTATVSAIQSAPVNVAIGFER